MKYDVTDDLGIPQFLARSQNFQTIPKSCLDFHDRFRRNSAIILGVVWNSPKCTGRWQKHTGISELRSKSCVNESLLMKEGYLDTPLQVLTRVFWYQDQGPGQQQYQGAVFCTAPCCTRVVPETLPLVVAEAAGKAGKATQVWLSSLFSVQIYCVASTDAMVPSDPPMQARHTVCCYAKPGTDVPYAAARTSLST
eukprot:3911639-Rhodomonas_salina.1